MAEEKKTVDTHEELPHGGGNKRLMVFIIIGVILVGLLGGGGLWLLSGHGKSSETHSAAAPQAAKKPEAPPVFLKLDTFVVNLAGPSGALLQIDTQAELVDVEAQKRLTDYMPKLRSAVILLLSSKTPEELASPEGKLKLKTQIKMVINGSIDSTSTDGPVKNILFTSFIIQKP